MSLFFFSKRCQQHDPVCSVKTISSTNTVYNVYVYEFIISYKVRMRCNIVGGFCFCISGPNRSVFFLYNDDDDKSVDCRLIQNIPRSYIRDSAYAPFALIVC